MFEDESAYFSNSIDYRLFVRAALHRLDGRVSQGRPPPNSRYPRLIDGTLISPETAACQTGASARSWYAFAPRLPDRAAGLGSRGGTSADDTAAASHRRRVP